MADTRYLDWPFFEPRHAELARTLDDWAGRHIADTHGADVDAECRRLVKTLGAGGWLRHAVGGKAHGGAQEVRRWLAIRAWPISRLPCRVWALEPFH